MLLAAVPYVPSLGGDFVYDDPNAVSQSTLIRSLTPISTFLTLSTRPLTDYTYAIDYAIGGLDPSAYHATGIVLHVITSVLVYVFAWLTLGLPSLAPRYGRARFAIALAAAALFAAHPLASETVAYISSRSESLAGMWYLVAVIAYIRATTGPAGTSVSVGLRHRVRGDGRRRQQGNRPHALRRAAAVRLAVDRRPRRAARPLLAGRCCRWRRWCSPGRSSSSAPSAAR